MNVSTSAIYEEAAAPAAALAPPAPCGPSINGKLLEEVVLTKRHELLQAFMDECIAGHMSG